MKKALDSFYLPLVLIANNFDYLLNKSKNIPHCLLEKLQNTVLTKKGSLPISCLRFKGPMKVLNNTKLILNESE